MTELFVMRGLPASGKSTLARQMLKESPKRIRISKDDLRNMLYGGVYTPEFENIILDIRDHLIGLYSYLGYDIIIDDTNLNPKHLERLSLLTETLDIHLNIILLHTSVDECIKRDAERSSPVGERVIKDMYEKYKA